MGSGVSSPEDDTDLRSAQLAALNPISQENSSPDLKLLENLPVRIDFDYCPGGSAAIAITTASPWNTGGNSLQRMGQEKNSPGEDGFRYGNLSSDLRNPGNCVNANNSDPMTKR